MAKWLAWVGALIAVIQPSLADTAIRGAGTMTCAKFLEFKESQPKEARQLFETWTYGFLSGINMTLATRKRKLVDLGSDPEKHWSNLVFACTMKKDLLVMQVLLVWFDKLRKDQGLPGLDE